MTKETFNEIIEMMKKEDHIVDGLYAFKVDIINSDIYENFNKLINIIIKNDYGDIGLDWFDWYVYEKMMSNNDLKAYDENNNEIIRNLDELYDYLETNCKNISKI